MGKLDIESASREISKLLSGTALDTFRVFSTILLLGFIRTNSDPQIPSEIWVSLSGAVHVIDKKSILQVNLSQDQDFFSQRIIAISRLFPLFGKQVISAAVGSAGALSINVDGVEIRCEADEINFEEIWAVMSDSPNPSENHRWYIALDDAGIIGGNVNRKEKD